MKVLFAAMLSYVCLGASAQWNKVNKKTNYVYSQCSFRLKYNAPKDRYDTVSKKQMANFSISIDTIIHLSGTGRRLIVFSKSFHSFRISDPKGIVKGKIEDLPKTPWGLPDNLKEIAVPEKFKRTIVYQFGTESYAITIPTDFLEKTLIKQNKLYQFDKALLSLPTEANFSFPLITEKYLFFDGMSIPFDRFIEFDKGSKKLSELRESSYAEPGSTFYTYKKNTKATNSNADFYSVDHEKNEVSSLYFDNNWGITRVYYESDPNGNEFGDGICLTLISIN